MKRNAKYSAFAVTLLLLAASSLTAQTGVVTTQHNDNARTGQITTETTLTLANVNVGNFGKLASISLDGQTYAQPLVINSVPIAGGTHNVVYVATEHDSVYALDANTGAQYWHTSFINPAAGITTIPSGKATGSGCSDISPEYGITSTPVINPATKTLYVVANTSENGAYYYRLHALNISTGAEVSGSPVVITDPGGLLNANHMNQRSALLLSNNHVIFSFSAHCDNDNWYGFVFSYNASTLLRENVFIPVSTANGSHAGVWMGGDGIAADASGNLYFATGNGTYGTGSYGDSIVKLPPPPTGTWTPLDWYSPGNQSHLDSSDLDIGSGGVVLLPDLPAGTAHQQRLAQAGKDSSPSTISILDRNQFTTGNVHYCCSPNGPDTDIVQEINSQIAGGMFGAPSYWNGYIYFGGSGDYIKAFSFNLTTGAVSGTPVAESPTTYGGSAHQSGTTSVSSNGTSNGIVWALDSGTGILHALNATNLTELYNSNIVPSRDFLAAGIKFLAPTIANGKVYIGSSGKLGIYGENPAGLIWSGYFNQPESQYSCGAPQNGSGVVTVSATQTGVNSLTWNISASSGQSITGVNWSINDSAGYFGSGSLTSSGGIVTVSRLPQGTPTISGSVLTYGSSPYNTYSCGVSYYFNATAAL